MEGENLRKGVMALGLMTETYHMVQKTSAIPAASEHLLQLPYLEPRVGGSVSGSPHEGSRGFFD